MDWKTIVPTAGLIVALVPLAALGGKWLLRFRGDLAGYWYQVTYNPEDENLEQPCFSIELMRLTHWRDTVRGTWWRIYKEDFYKRWSWEGKLEGAFVIGSYFAGKKSKAGGSGNFFMMEIGEGRVKGHFMCVVVDDTAASSIGFEPRVWPMEWLRADRCAGAKLARWIESLPDRPCDCRPLRSGDGHVAIDHLPWYARRALGHSGWPNARKDTAKGAAYAGAMSAGPLPGLAVEESEREAKQAVEHKRLLPIPHLRRIDILGKLRSPRERPETS